MKAIVRGGNTVRYKYVRLAKVAKCLLPALALALSAASCKPASSQPETPAQVTVQVPKIGGKGMSVLFISVDTQRADHLGCYGHPEVKTPNIDRFAEEGTRFAWCISPAPLTLPSHATMLTGCDPYVHGARDNGIFVVSEPNVTLAEIFKGAGYATHAEVAALVLHKKYGLDQGFDYYGDVDPQLLERILPIRKQPKAGLDLEATTQPVIEPEVPEVEVERKATEITDAAIEALTPLVQGDLPFFVFLHYFDPHWPHDAPEPFASEYKDGYYAETAYFDAEFGRLMETVRQLGLAGNTLVILTSDHGEGRGQHGELTHSTCLYDTTLHVPLIMWCPGQVPAGQVVDSQVRLIDLAQTMLEFVRLEHMRTKQMQGTSLLPLLTDPNLNLHLACYSDTMVPKTMYGYAPLRSLRTESWKYILAPRSELYHVAEDQMELFNKAEVEAERSATMREDLREVIANAPSPPGVRGTWRSMDEIEMRRMEALGYVSTTLAEDPALTAGSELDFFEPEGINPRDRIESVECMAAGLGAFRIGEYDEVERIMSRFCELEPDSPVGPSYMGRALMVKEQFEEAEKMFRQAIKLRPEGFFEHRALGVILAKREEYAESEKEFNLAIQYNPEDPIGHFNRGKLLAVLQRYDEALPDYEEALKRKPKDPAIHYLKGVALRQTSRFDEAIAAFREALRLDSSLVDAHVQLARALRESGRIDEVIEYLGQVIKEIPDSAMLHHGLAECYGQNGDLEQAGVHLARVVELLPENPRGQQNLGVNFLDRRMFPEAIEYLRRALELDPKSSSALFYLARALEAVGELNEAAETYEQLLKQAPRNALAYVSAANLFDRRGQPERAIELLRKGHEFVPGNPNVANDLAWMLATSPRDDLRDGAEAVRLARSVCQITESSNPNHLDTLAAACAEVGDFDAAIRHARKAVELATALRNTFLVQRIRARLELYELGRPYREPPMSSTAEGSVPQAK